MSTAARFQDLIDREEIVVAPGCYDALTAKILAKEGFDAVYLSGAGVSNTQLGMADAGLTTMTEMVDQATHVAAAVDVPVFADADTGYGNPVNVYRTVQRYEQAGVAALHIEDQAFPKRCGHFDGHTLVSTEEMVQKIRAAADARTEMLVVARTDARDAAGIDEAIDRANMYLDAGADMVFPEAPRDRSEIQRFCDEIPGPVMANMVEHGKTPLLSADDLQDLGCALVIFPNSLLRAAMQTMTEIAAHLHEKGTTADITGKIADFDLRNALTDYDTVTERENRYAPK